MVIHTYGNRTDKVILMLHPMGFTGKEIVDHFVPHFKNHYFIIAPDMGNHGDDKGDFKSMDEEMNSLYEYLKSNNIMHIDLVLGLSMGAAGALILMQHKDLEFDQVYLDGAPVARMGFIMRTIFAPVLIWVKNSMVKNLDKANAEYVDRYGEILGNQMGQNFLKFTDESIKNIADVCVRGNIFKISPDMQKHIYFDWGSKEDYYKTSTPLVRKIYPDTNVIIRENYAHCEYMAKHPEEYVSYLEEKIS